jgi:choline dehydrogenase-like flavoprotein
MILSSLKDLTGVEPDVCVIGAGPVGIILALELSRRGKTVFLVESGSVRMRKDVQLLSDADIADLNQHVQMDVAVRRQLGGTSNLWGGRCVPMDPLDFEPRPQLNEKGWPIRANDLAPFLQAACNYLGCGEAMFESPIPGLAPVLEDFRVDRLERWSMQAKVGKVHSREIQLSRNLTLCLLATAVNFKFDSDNAVQSILLRGPDGAQAEIKARDVVLAAGGLENTRLMLAMRRESPRRFGDPDGPLGRYYMGHLTGSLASIGLHSPLLDQGLDYFNDAQGYCVRRRFWPGPELQRRKCLTNMTFRTEFPRIYDPNHNNGVLSLAYLGLSYPQIARFLVSEVVRRTHLGEGPVSRAAHWRNFLRDIPHVAAFFPKYLSDRFIFRSRSHSFFERCQSRVYRLVYHAEHLPDENSRVSLTDDFDAFGLPRLSVNFRYSMADAEAILRGHECFATWLSRTGLGSLYWFVRPEDRIAHILNESRDGRHQIGTTRMGETPKTGVVDRDCRVFGMKNLFIAGTSTFTTSSQANPTLTAVALGLRLAQELTHSHPLTLEIDGVNGRGVNGLSVLEVK